MSRADRPDNVQTALYGEDGKVPVTVTYGVIASTEAETEARREIDEYVRDQKYIDTEKPLVCICAFLTVVIIVLIILIALRGNCLRERMQAKGQILYFYRPSCPYCQQFDPTWDEFVEQVRINPDVDLTLRKINCSDQTMAAACAKESKHYGMRGVPHIVRIKKDGKHMIFKDERSIEKLMTFAMIKE